MTEEEEEEEEEERKFNEALQDRKFCVRDAPTGRHTEVLLLTTEYIVELNAAIRERIPSCGHYH